MVNWRAALSSPWFKLALSAALLGLLLLETDVGEIRAAIAGADLRWLFLSVVALIASQAVSAYRWCVLARAVGFDEPFARFGTYYFSGMYLNIFGPGTVTGDVSRTLFLAAGHRRALALTTVIAHRAIGFVALVWITATAILVLRDHPLPTVVRGLAALAIPGTVLGWLWGPRLAARLLPPANKWRHMIERDLAAYWHNHRLLVQSLALAGMAHALQLGSQMMVARALSLQVPWTFFLVVVPAVNAAGMLPFSLQGIGIRETGFWYYLSQLGVSRESAVALGLLTSTTVVAVGLSGLPFFLLTRRQDTAISTAARQR